MDKNLVKDKSPILAQKDPQPKVSVHILTQNRAALLPLAIESAINQTYRNLEIIILDTNSTDKTETLVKRYCEMDRRITYIRVVENNGITKARNMALASSHGKYIAVLDSDDFWLAQDKLEKQVNFLEKNPDYAVVGTHAVVVDSANQKIDEIKNKITWPEIQKFSLIKNQIVHSGALIRKSALDEIGGYDDQYKIWEDYATTLKIGRHHKMANIDEFLTAYKKHDGNISNSSKIKNLFVLGNIITRNRKYYPSFFTAIVLVKIRMIASIFKLY